MSAGMQIHISLEALDVVLSCCRCYDGRPAATRQVHKQPLHKFHLQHVSAVTSHGTQIVFGRTGQEMHD